MQRLGGKGLPRASWLTWRKVRLDVRLGRGRAPTHLRTPLLRGEEGGQGGLHEELSVQIKGRLRGKSPDKRETPAEELRKKKNTQNFVARLFLALSEVLSRSKDAGGGGKVLGER